MHNEKLISLADQLHFDNDASFDLRVAFSIACIERVQHLLIDVQIVQALQTGMKFVAGDADREQLVKAASLATKASRSHAGTNSLDGSGSAAVSSSHGVAAALAGRALDAAGYAAYAKVYAYASHSVTDSSAYETEHDWQLVKLQELASLNSMDEPGMKHK